MTVTICATGYSARVSGKSLGVYEREWEARGQCDGKALLRIRPEQVTVSLWLSGWRALFPSEQDRRTRETEHYMLRPFAEAYGDRLMVSLTPMEVQAWASEHPAQVRWLRMAWSRAYRLGVVPVNLWRFVELPGRAGRVLRRPPTAPELDAILAGCEARGGWWLEFRDMIVVAAYTGARMGGLMSLERDTVDLGARRMVVTEKGGKARVVVVPGQALGALTRALPRHEAWSPVVFRAAKGRAERRGVMNKNGVAKAWREVRGGYPHTFHCLKHFAATWMLEQGADEKAVAIQLGHYDSEGRPYPELLQRVYDHPDHGLALERLERAVAA